MASVGFPYKKSGSPLGGPRNHAGTYESPLFLIFVVLRSVRKWQEAGM